MSLIPLDFVPCSSGTGAMTREPRYQLTTTQIGAIGESVAATGLVLASGGRLAPFKPYADDDGIDLLIYDKASKAVMPLQVKSRTKVDNEKAMTVQFDTRKATFSDEGGSRLLALLLDGTDLACAWLIPMADLKQGSRESKTKYTVVASAKTTSNDRFTPYRHFSHGDLAQAVIAAFSA